MTTRRRFLKNAVAAGAGLFVGGPLILAQGESPNNKLNLAVIGVGGRGAANLDGVRGENIVALCDVDDRALAKAAKGLPDAKTYFDFRKMYDAQHKEFDAVVIATPDHTHAVAAVAAMKLGKHVYCEKPLARSIYETRAMVDAAAKSKVATQMGNQGHSSTSRRKLVELLWSGALGTVKEVHAWTDRPIWPQGIDRPQDAQDIPPYLHWDEWLGPAPERPFHIAYHPFKWRGWWDFGTGALGDMGCHVLDPVFWGLKLGYPTTVEAEGEPHKSETAPKWSVVRFGFPSVTLTWYDGKKKPAAELFEGQPESTNGVIIVGEKGRVVVADAQTDRWKALPEEKFKDVEADKKLPRSPGHHAEWMLACKGRGKALSSFDVAGPFTEAILLGNLALRLGKKIEWDPAAMKAKGCPEADALIRPEFRKGWSL